MKLAKYFILFAFTLLMSVIIIPSQAVTPTTPKFTEGKDYQTIPENTHEALKAKPGHVNVVEFFSFACPHCYHLEPILEKWLSSQTNDVHFSRIPVVFNPNWQILAKAYYAANALGVAKKVSPAIFNAIHKQQRDLNNEHALAEIFKSVGVNTNDFDSAFNFSPGIDAQLLQGKQLMTTYKVFEVPTVIINGQYKTNPVMAGSEQRFVKVLSYLVSLAKER